jgi:DNA-directed RNA polymerase specialized sigma24 family protein
VSAKGKQANGGNPTSLAELIASLPEEERIILTLHYLRSLSSSQIAELLRVPERSVVVVIAAGKARLTSHLGL